MKDDETRLRSELLASWLLRQIEPERRKWIEDRREELRASGPGAARDRALWKAIGLATRKVGKDDLRLDADDLRAAAKARPGWDPSGWSVDQAARLVFLLTPDLDPAELARKIDEVCRTADLGELVTVYRGLPLFPGPERYAARAAEGVRSNIKAVFEAVAHRNPVPSEVLDESAWNQMVLKALFVSSTLWPVVGLDERANPELARMLIDYAHERRAAGRSVPPELWRCVAPFVDSDTVGDLEIALRSESALERRAARCALEAVPADSPARSRAEELLAAAPSEASSAGTDTWEAIGKEHAG